MGSSDTSYAQRVVSEVKSCAFYRDLIAELIGTFFLVSIQIILTVIPSGNYAGDIIRISLGMGFIVASLVEALGTYGGANLNPAVSLGLALCGRITALRALMYMIAQVGGGIGGAAFIWAVSPEAAIDPDQGGSFALTMVAPHIQPWQGMLVEGWATAILVFTVLGATDTKRRSIMMPAIPIGFAVACALLSAIPFTGASINPARTLGPAVIATLFMDDKTAPFKDHWVYWAGPLGGAVVAAITYLIFHLADRKQVDEQNDG